MLKEARSMLEAFNFSTLLLWPTNQPFLVIAQIWQFVCDVIVSPAQMPGKNGES